MGRDHHEKRDKKWEENDQEGEVDGNSWFIYGDPHHVLDEEALKQNILRGALPPGPTREAAKAIWGHVHVNRIDPDSPNLHEDWKYVYTQYCRNARYDWLYPLMLLGQAVAESRQN